MTAAEVYHGFWAQFGIPAYEEGAAFAVPAPAVRCPCLTYRYGEGDRADLTVSLRAEETLQHPDRRNAVTVPPVLSIHTGGN